MLDLELAPKFGSMENFVRFVLAGNAIFTIQNRETGNRFTYKIKVSDNNPHFFFVSVLNGPDNWTNYAYIGVISKKPGHTIGMFEYGAKSKIGEQSQSVKSFLWFWIRVTRATLPDIVFVYHANKCGRCGRKLTVPESVETGFGPECINKI
jgi:hypothetical protein